MQVERYKGDCPEDRKSMNNFQNATGNTKGNKENPANSTEVWRGDKKEATEKNLVEQQTQEKKMMKIYPNMSINAINVSGLNLPLDDTDSQIGCIGTTKNKIHFLCFFEDTHLKQDATPSTSKLQRKKKEMDGNL